MTNCKYRKHYQGVPYCVEKNTNCLLKNLGNKEKILEIKVILPYEKKDFIYLCNESNKMGLK